MITRVCSVTVVACPLSIKYVLSTGRHDLMSYLIVGAVIMLHVHFTDENTQAQRDPQSPKTRLRTTGIRCPDLLQSCSVKTVWSPPRGRHRDQWRRRARRVARLLLPQSAPPSPWEQVGPTSLAAAPSATRPQNLIPTCLPDKAIWISHKHLKVGTSRTEPSVLTSCSPPVGGTLARPSS